MTDLFSAYKVRSNKANIHAYLIESTAPDNIDDPTTIQQTPPNTDRLGADDAIDKITDTLAGSANPTLVVSIHGFNNPRKVILQGYWDSFNLVINDSVINNRDVICIGYRWPSEYMGAPFFTAFKAAPSFLKGLLLFGIILTAIYFLAHDLANYHVTALLGFGAIALLTSFTLFILRIIVYFRDGYRATSFGIPDLVEIIRQIDKKLAEKTPPRNHVQLSFIGHSMGAYVVTSVVRILSDVFDPFSMRSSLNPKPGDSPPAKLKTEIGKVFRLMRLVLVSPGIPAEALISSRANFLSTSLLRFEEAFLFSNDGDEVLRQISTTANYFSFPTRSNKFGYRLGNICLPEVHFDITSGVELKLLQIGQITIHDVYNKMNKIGSGQLRDDLPKHFSYFDCTDCVENGKGILTLAKPNVIKKMTPIGHFRLLLCYIVRPRIHDVHGGYFRSKFLSALIYRLACIGYNDTEQAYGGIDSMDNECRIYQIKALLK
jgi:hypothetical protein